MLNKTGSRFVGLAVAWGGDGDLVIMEKKMETTIYCLSFRV